VNDQMRLDTAAVLAAYKAKSGSTIAALIEENAHLEVYAANLTARITDLEATVASLRSTTD
jgi:hypothetical protein